MTQHQKMTEATAKRYQRLGIVIALIGGGLAVFGALGNMAQFWQSYLLAYIFWLEIGLGSLGLLMLHHLVGGRWSAMIRRLMEAGSMTLPLMALLFIPFIFGLPTLYRWANPEELLHSELLQQKTAYLNVPFFYVRAVVYFVVWLGLAYGLQRLSLVQDEDDISFNIATRMRRLSAIGMILYVLTSTFAAFDWMMSLEPEWFSSIYGLLFISGQGLAALALAIIGLRYLATVNASGAHRAQSWARYFNDLGNFLLGFVMIWAYVSFSQFLVIWSANIPEEAIWYYHRTQGGWQTVAVFLIAFHFILPFFLLLIRQVKRKAQLLFGLAALILIARLVDLYWLIVPAFHPEGVHFHWLDLALLLAVGGLWLFVFMRQWARMYPLPLHDINLQETNHEHPEPIAATQ